MSSSPYKIYFRLFKYLKPLWLPFTVSLVGFAIFASSQPMLAKLMELVVGAINAKNSDARWTLPFIAVGIFAVRGFGSFLGTYYNTYVAARLVSNIRVDMFNHLTTLPASYFATNSDGKIFQRLTGSVNLISQAFTEAIRTLIREGLTIIFLLAYVFYLNWKLSLTFLAIAPFLLLVVNYTTKRFRTLTKKNENIMATLVQALSELIRGHEVMRIFGGQDYEQQRHIAATEKSFKNALKIRKISAMSTPVVQLLVAAALAVIIFLLLDPVTLATSSSEELIGYLTAVGLLPKSMKQLSGLNVYIQRGITGAELIFQLLDMDAERDTGKHQADRVRGHIVFDNVCFRYHQSQPLILDHISFEVPQGKTVALVGKSGSGKSTLVSLLQRLYDTESGSITMDGISINEYTLKNLRQHIAFVGQNLVLFNDTVRNNIAYGPMAAASDEQIIEAARRAHALEFIEGLPQGFDTPIGDNGLELSGGQRQRIAIARAFLKDAPVLILDEATSALDNQSEHHIQCALEEVMKGRTTIVIAHRLSTIEKAHNICVMESGRITESGTHEQLLQKAGPYAALYRTALIPSQG